MEYIFMQGPEFIVWSVWKQTRESLEFHWNCCDVTFSVNTLSSMFLNWNFER